jgi:RNA polymerase sigma-70 factor (ECF subfamily)
MALEANLDEASAFASAMTRASEPIAATRVPSFDELYDAEFGFVWRTVRALGASAAERDDLVQEVFLVVHKRLPAFEPRGSLRSWLYGIVRLVVMRSHRTRRRKPSHAGKAEATDVDAFEDTAGLDPEALAQRAEAVVALDRALDALDEDKREVFVLAELEQMTLAEIAAAIGVNANTVASRLGAARRRFESELCRLEKANGRPRWG